MIENKNLTTFGTIVVSVLIVVGFIFVYTLAYMHNDTDSVKTLNGIIAAAMMTVVGFWIGTSQGSRNKDELIQKRIEEEPLALNRSQPNFPRTPS